MYGKDIVITLKLVPENFFFFGGWVGEIVCYIMFHCFNNPCKRSLLKVAVALAHVTEKLNS